MDRILKQLGAIILIFIILSCANVEVTQSEYNLREGNWTCGSSNGDSIIFSVIGGNVNARYFLPNEFKSSKPYDSIGFKTAFTFKGDFKGSYNIGSLNGFSFTGNFNKEFKIFLLDTVEQQRYYLNDSIFLPYFEYTGIDSIILKDTTIYVLVRPKIDTLEIYSQWTAFGYRKYDTLITHSVAYWKKQKYTIRGTKNFIIDTLKNDKDTVTFSEVKGDLNSEFRLRAFRTSAGFSSENSGYWIYCKLSQ